MQIGDKLAQDVHRVHTMAHMDTCLAGETADALSAGGSEELSDYNKDRFSEENILKRRHAVLRIGPRNPGTLPPIYTYHGASSLCCTSSDSTRARTAVGSDDGRLLLYLDGGGGGGVRLVLRLPQQVPRDVPRRAVAPQARTRPSPSSLSDADLFSLRFHVRDTTALIYAIAIWSLPPAAFLPRRF